MQSSPGIHQWLSFVCVVVRAFEARRDNARQRMNVLGVGTACWATKRVDVPNAAGAFRVRSVAHWLISRNRTSKTCRAWPLACRSFVINFAPFRQAQGLPYVPSSSRVQSPNAELPSGARSWRDLLLHRGDGETCSVSVRTERSTTTEIMLARGKAATPVHH